MSVFVVVDPDIIYGKFCTTTGRKISALQEISCKGIGMVMYIRSVLNRKAFLLFTALFFSTSKVSVCKARMRTASVGLLPSVWKTCIQSFFLSFTSLYLSNDWTQVTTGIAVFCLENKVFVCLICLFRNPNIMKCQYCSGVLFLLLNEMP